MFALEEVVAATKKLNTNRAPDPQVLMAEHLKYAPYSALIYLTELFNDISSSTYIPSAMARGDIITIPQNGKDPSSMNNHRGTTITSVIAKVLEHVINSRVKSVLLMNQHSLQYGFTEKLSLNMAALICTEVLANNKDLV